MFLDRDRHPVDPHLMDTTDTEPPTHPSRAIAQLVTKPGHFSKLAEIQGEGMNTSVVASMGLVRVKVASRVLLGWFW